MLKGFPKEWPFISVLSCVFYYRSILHEKKLGNQCTVCTEHQMIALDVRGTQPKLNPRELSLGTNI